MAKSFDYSEIRQKFDFDVLGNEDSIRQLEDEFGYQGFDPKQMENFIIKQGCTEVRKMVNQMIVLGINRGNNLEKMLKTISESGVATVRNLRAVFSLKSTIAGDRKKA